MDDELLREVYDMKSALERVSAVVEQGPGQPNHGKPETVRGVMQAY